MTHRNKRRPHKIKTKRNLLRTKGFWYAILALVLLSVAFYFIIFFDKVQVKNIYISGNNKAPTKQIEDLVLKEINKKILFFQSKSIFLADISGIRNKILENFPITKEAKITRRFFNTLNIVVKEREPQAIFCEPAIISEACYFIDETGTPFEETQQTETRSPFVIVRQYGNEGAALGKQIINEKTLGYILKLKKSLNDKYGVAVDSAEIVSDIRLNIKTNEGWEVYFNLSADMDLQITKLILLLEKEIPEESRGQLKYIDLRFKDRAYYK